MKCFESHAKEIKMHIYLHSFRLGTALAKAAAAAGPLWFCLGLSWDLLKTPATQSPGRPRVAQLGAGPEPIPTSLSSPRWGLGRLGPGRSSGRPNAVQLPFENGSR